MSTYTIKPYLSLLVLMIATACQPVSENQAALDAEPTQVKSDIKQAQLTDTKNTQDIDAVEARITSDASNNKANKADCNNVRDNMAQVSNTSKIDAIHKIQSQLPACLQQTDNATALALLKDYDAMYDRFLNDASQSELEIDSFYTIAYKLDMGEPVSKAEYVTLSPHTQYLLKLSQSDADVTRKYLGEGFYTFSHDLSAMTSIFAPYLAEDSRAFVERMAKDNQEVFWNDAAINVSFEDLLERALFWEDYLQRFPNSRHTKEAKELYNTYRYTLFFGSDNTGWTDDAIHNFMEPQYKKLMIKLSHRQNSQLAKDAKKFLQFMATSDDERRGDIERNDDEYQYIYIAKKRADEVMQIPTPWNTEHSDTIDCFAGIFCYEINYE